MPKDKPLDQDQADENAMNPLDERIDGLELAGGGQLVASIVTELVDIWKHLPKRFDDATKGQQQDVFRRFEALGKDIVQQVAQRIAEQNADKSVLCVVGKATIDSEIKVDLKTAPQTSEKRDAAILFLAHARGRHVVVRMASAEEFAQEAPEDPSQEDQAELGFEAGSDTVDEPDDEGREAVSESGNLVGAAEDKVEPVE